MGRIIVGTGLAGIAAIVWIAWRMADRRIAQCDFDRDCVIRMTTQRDYILTAGLAVALAFVIASLCVFAIVKARQGSKPIELRSGWSPANRGQRARLS